MVQLNKDCTPAIIFLVLYAIFFGILTRLYATRKIAWKSRCATFRASASGEARLNGSRKLRYTFVFAHVVLRIGGQACGITFALMSWDTFTPRLNVLSMSTFIIRVQIILNLCAVVAYLVLAAEG